MSDDLIARAKAASEGAVLPDEWGKLIELLEDGDAFVGRYRGTDSADGFKSSAYLFWDEDDELRFLWSCYRLDQEFEREPASLGDTVAIFRGQNYWTRFDDAGEATGLSYGIAVEKNAAPLPVRPEPDGDIPF
jgi:hypothetical protein